MSAENEVREASNKFYAALNQTLCGENNRMADVWSHNSSVTTLHPIGGREVGWDKVNDSFNQVSKIASDGRVVLKNQMIQVFSDMAFEVGIEQVQQLTLAGQDVKGEVRVTNIYHKDGDAWKMIHHHSDTLPVMMEILASLQSK